MGTTYWSEIAVDLAKAAVVIVCRVCNFWKSYVRLDRRRYGQLPSSLIKEKRVVSRNKVANMKDLGLGLDFGEAQRLQTSPCAA